ncbi:Imm49 family immunity protein [Kribbella sp. NPDC051718]|uniref:Imm49 family immunity protein n=1 Tax=Kribbella sp. NPDC051718 TaxID=3155168 RepID=UPI00343D90D7
MGRTGCEANPGEPNARDPLGFIALGPLCLAAIARQRGIAFAVRSEYLPERLIR